jgi:alpha-1,6-mannosyltransferase
VQDNVAVAWLGDGRSDPAHHRKVQIAFVALSAMLLALAFVTVRHRDGSARAPGLSRSAWEVPFFEALGLGSDGAINADAFRRMAVSARLFHGLPPEQLALRIGYYAIVAWGAVIALWAIYLWLIWSTRSRRVDPRFVAVGAVALSVLAFVIPPVFSTDSFSYAMFGRLDAAYGVNPYTTTPAAVAPHDPLLPYVYWRHIPSPYGPLWTWLSSGAVSDTSSPLVLVLRFKLISLLATLLNGWLIYRFVRRRWPDEAGWAYLAFAWNPLVLVEGVVAAHNDAVLLTGVLIAAHLLARARAELSITALFVASLIKYTVAPVAGIAALRLLIRTPAAHRPRLVARLAVGTAAIVMVAMPPYWSGGDVLAAPLSQPENGLNNPLSLGLSRGLTALPAGDGPLGRPTLLVVSAGLLFLIWEVAKLRQAWRDRSSWTVEAELAHWAATFTALILVFPRIYTWYFLVPLGLALAAGSAHRRTFAAILGLSLLSYVTYFN